MNKKNANETAKKMSNVYDLGVITDRQVRNRFSKFCFAERSLRGEARSGRSSDFNQNALRKLVECNPHKNTRELALDLNTSQSTICSPFEKDSNRFCFKAEKWSVSQKYHSGRRKKCDFMTMFIAKGCRFLY